MSAAALIRGDPLHEELPVGMKFRLHYEGPLLSAKGDALGAQEDRRAPHKHAIRRAFHAQLAHLWEIHPWLSEEKMPWDMFGVLSGDSLRGEEGDYRNHVSLADGLAKLHKVGEFSFVPLVCAQFKLLCGVKLLLLRRDKPGGVISARDWIIG